MDLAKVVDIPMQVLAFTWSNNREFKSWRVKEKIPCDKEVKSLEEDLAEIEKKAIIRWWTRELRQERSCCLVKLWKQICLEEHKWRQILRVKWLNEGDRNTRYFHILSNVRRKANGIGDLLISSRRCSGPPQLRECVFSFFKDQFKKEMGHRPRISGLPIKQILMQEKTELEAEFSVEEVFIQDDFMKFMHEFYRNGSVVKDLNHTFITLILKIRSPESLKDYRPISSVGSLYKVLVKVLANMIKNMMNSVVGPSQIAFVKGHQIVDSFVIAEEIIHSWKRDGKWGLLLKLDFEKAYDSVDHAFLLHVLDRMGFGKRWQEWIGWCIGSPSISVLVNSSPTYQFQMERGLCQGDPFSHFLYNLVVEVLKTMIFKDIDLGLIKEVGFGDNVIHISHLQFADDTVLFIEPSLEYLSNMKRILRCYELASGLKINFHKSCLVKVRKKDLRDENWAKVFRCSLSSLPLTYLGLPLGGISNREAFWKVHTVDWNTLCKNKRNGGLGIERLRDKGLGLMAKWIWRFGREQSSLWKKVLCVKYGLDQNSLLWNRHWVKSRSYFFKSINGLFAEGQCAYNIINKGFQVVRGNRERIKLWKNCLWDFVPLKLAFVRIFALALNKEGIVKEFGRLFSVISFCRCLEEGRDTECSSFSFLWKGFCPSKVEFFAWQLLKGSILVRDVLQVLRAGQVELWAICMSWRGLSWCSNFSVIEWVKSWKGLCPSPKRGREWDTLFFVIIWTIWEFRNNVVFRGTQANLDMASNSVKFRVAWWFKNHGGGSNVDLTLLLLDIKERCIDKASAKAVTSKGWSYPTENKLFFNMDGSANGSPGEAGIRGLLRNVSRRILCLFSYYLGIKDSRTAEIHAILRACQLISSNQFLINRNITIISDSLSLVSWIKGKDFGNFELVRIMYDIRHFLQDRRGLDIEFKQRSSNSLADSLAKAGSSRCGDKLE
ncbi:hypothetical protein Ddye_014647 [Dipteronia dyeriana]|uniref:Reverse transcriptase domain-containing protein n=1 Tax=Dipteronia dyeriana TaxID=168575 RepID=A0AAE0CKT7_9ROSI|nr:hypothetical protein Ddye_014647 [Dipteronia dyeriana]